MLAAKSQENKPKTKGTRRYIGAVWENSTKKGDTFLSCSIDVLESDAPYYSGNLLWVEEDTIYEVRGFGLVDPRQPEEGELKLITIDTENAYNVVL